MLRKNSPFLSAAKNLVPIIVFLAQIVFAQPFTEEEKKILEMQDKRIVNHEMSWVDSLNWTRNFYALYNIQDSTQLIELKKYYEDSPSFLQKANILYFVSAFNSKSAVNFAYEVLKDDPELKKMAFYILSKSGDENNLKDISNYEISENLKRNYFEIIYEFSKRKIGNINAFEKVKELTPYNSEMNEELSYSLNRTAIIPAISLFKDELQKNISSTEYTTRMWSISAIGKLQDTSSIDFFLDVLSKEIDWRVRVNIVNALGNHKIDLNSPLLEKTTNMLIDLAANDPSVHVSVVSWQSLGKLFTGADTRNPMVRKIQQDILFRTGQNSQIDWHIKAEAIRTYAKIFKDEAKADLFAIFNSTDNYDIKSVVVESFGFFDDPMVYKELRENVSNDVMKYNEVHPNKDGSMIGSNDLAKMYRAFVSGLTELDDKMDSENRNIIRLILSEFASSKDAPLTEICLSNLQDSIYLQYRAETCQIMTFDYQSFTLPKDKDVMLMYIEAWGNMKFDGAKDILTTNLKSSDYDIAKASSDALQKITGEDRSGKITAPKYRTDFDWEFIAKLEQKKFATIKTNQGNIVIELEEAIAPFTVQNFVKLSEKGFYNNTVFHRVVPNFVIQGGDPTGTGFGGPGYSIRSEFSPLPFDAYTIGMASSGKDTEGSQFFITHSPQPHLDGKYTMFGKVVEGFDVVDKIQIGDVIETITFSASR